VPNPTDRRPSPSAPLMDTAVEQARDAVYRLCAPRGWIKPFLCGCGRPDCRNDDERTASLATMLRAAATSWTDEPEPSREAALRDTLLAFARVFRLDECPAGTPGCRCTRIGDGDAHAVLVAVADAWHGHNGNLVSPTPQKIEAMARAHARNAAALEVLARRLDPGDEASFRRMLPLAAASEGAWRAEARAVAAEAIATWIPQPTTIPEVGRVLDGALSIALHGEWTTPEAALAERVAADVCSALLVRGFTHPFVTESLYAPFSGLVALDDLDAAVDADWIAEALPD
jgi:hypothetical protein